MHAEQILPLLALATTGLAATARRSVTLAAAAAIAGLTFLVFAQAVLGRPFPFG